MDLQVGLLGWFLGLRLCRGCAGAGAAWPGGWFWVEHFDEEVAVFETDHFGVGLRWFGLRLSGGGGGLSLVGFGWWL